jgi:hypothetical protein
MPPLSPKRNSDLDWELFARIDPHYAVATKDQYHKGNLDDETIALLFESGKEQVDQVGISSMNYWVDVYRSPRRGSSGGRGSLRQ